MNRNLLFAALIVLFSVLLFSGCSKNVSLVGYCTEISCSFASDKQYCYRDAAVQSSDSVLCEKIVESDVIKPIKDTCYIMIAKNTKNNSLCENILDSKLQLECKNI